MTNLYQGEGPESQQQDASQHKQPQHNPHRASNMAATRNWRDSPRPRRK